MTTNDLRQQILLNIRQKILDDMCRLGEMYLDDGNVDEALHWLELAASLGSENASCNLGDIYYFGKGVEKNIPKAAHYFEESGAWLYHDFEIGCIFGDVFRYGRGVEQNIDKAIFWYEIASNCGDNEERRGAMFALGEIYRDGEGGIKTDGEKAVKYFTELALGGGDYFFVTDTKLYEDGQNVPMSPSERDYFFSFDTANGDDAAKFALGCMYLYGLAVKKNAYKAAWWFAKTDELDHYDTGEVFDLAEMYRTGDGVKRDVEVAAAWYEWIIEYDAFHGKALFALAEIYFHGEGVERDVDNALNYYERAADSGNVKAAYTLSEIYRGGHGVKKDLSKSREFLDATIKGLLNKIEE